MNKAGYTVAWAGAIFRSPEHLGMSSEVKNCKNIKEVKCDGPTNEWTDKAGCIVA